MTVSSRHIIHQAPVIAALGRTVLSALLDRGGAERPPPTLPGPETHASFAPRPGALVHDYLRNVGAEPAAYRHSLPSHLFPQWGFALASKTLVGLRYPLHKALNAGCSLQMRAPLPNDEPLQVAARLESIDDDGRRAILTQRVVTGTASEPEALVAYMQVLVPLGGKSKSHKKKQRARVPSATREIARFRLGADAGLDFAKLTGDFNPVHWVPAYARASGFPRCILHGFATMARAIEGVNRAVLCGQIAALTSVAVRFTSPLVLPADVGLYLSRGTLEGHGPDAHCIHMGDGPGGRAYLTGTFTLRDEGGTTP